MSIRTVTMCSGLVAAVAMGTLACWPAVASAEGFAQYREFAIGSHVAAVVASTGVAASEVKTVHQRPALLQEIEWRPSRWRTGVTSQSNDPVERLAFSFYNDELFRIVVDYSPDRTEGMTGKDLTSALSDVYGAPLTGTVRAAAPASSLEIESGRRIARWGNTEHTVALYQLTSYRSSFRLIITDTRRAALARTADAEAVRLDEREAPQREAARETREREDEQAATRKARDANRATFQP